MIICIFTLKIDLYEFYQKFIKSYPDHELVPSVQFELDILNEYEKIAKELKKNKI